MPRPVVDRELLFDILRVLKRSSDYALPLDVLFTAVNGSRLDVVEINTFKDHLVHAEERGWVEYKVDRVDGRKRWFLTEAGSVTLAKG